MYDVLELVEAGGLDCWADAQLKHALAAIERVRCRVDACQALVLAELVRHRPVRRGRQRQDRDSMSARLLTDREIEVLQLMANGASTEGMATTLYVSAHTIRSHVRHILEKLGAHSKLEAVAMAIREGIVDVSPN